MKVQPITKLPERKGIAVAVRQGNKASVRIRTDCIAALNLAELTHLNHVPHSYLSAINDPDYGGSGPPPIDLDLLRMRAWLRAHSPVPDGLTCWMEDPNPDPKAFHLPMHGMRWNTWVGARHEYLKRSIRSRRNADHMLPDDAVRMPSIIHNAEQVFALGFKEIIEIIVNRLDTQYDGKKFLGDSSIHRTPALITADEHDECMLPIEQAQEIENRAVPKMQKAVLRDYYALRVRDVARSCNARLVFKSLHAAAKQERYEYLCTKYSVHSPGRRLSANGYLTIAIRPVKRRRHDELVYLMWAKFVDKHVIETAEQLDLPPVDSATDWLGLMPAGKMLKEMLQDKGSDPCQGGEVISTPETQVPPVQTPTEESTEEYVPVKESLWQAPEHSAQAWALEMPVTSGCLLDRVLENKAARQMRARLLRYNRQGDLHTLQRKEAALKIGMMGDGDMEKRDEQDTLIGPPPPTKLEEQYTLSPFEALVWNGRRTTDLFLEGKKEETDEWLRRIGGVSTFEQSESGLYLPPSDFDIDLKF